MKKYILIPIMIVMSLFTSCASYSYKTGFVKLHYTSPPPNLKAQINKDIEQEVFLRVSDELNVPTGSSILVVGAMANRETLYFVDALETELKASEFFDVKDSNSIQDFYPTYPCNTVSAENEKRRDYEGIVPGFETFDNRIMMEIGKALSVDYIYMVYVDEYGQFRYSMNVAKVSKVKGTLWDVNAGEILANTFFYETASAAVRSGFIIDNFYSKLEYMIIDISDQAASKVYREIRKDIIK